MSGSSNIQRGWELNVIKVTVSADRTGYNLYSLSKPPHPYKPTWIINKRTQGSLKLFSKNVILSLFLKSELKLQSRGVQKNDLRKKHQAKLLKVQWCLLCYYMYVFLLV